MDFIEKLPTVREKIADLEGQVQSQQKLLVTFFKIQAFIPQ